jgi:hypothetical protein
MPTPSADPIREQLIAKVRARLDAITAGSTYWFTPAEVVRDLKNFDEIKASYDAAAGTIKPTYCVIEGQERKDENHPESSRMVFLILDVTIVGWVKATKDRRTALNRAIGDVLTAIWTDEKWDGLALITDYQKSVTDQAAFQNNNVAYFEISIGIHYDRSRYTV